MDTIASGVWYAYAALALACFGCLLAVLLEQWCIRRTSRGRGARRRGGYLPRYAYTGMKEPGTRTPKTATSADSSFFLERGTAWEDGFVQTSRRLGSSYIARGSSTGATADRGGNGAPRPPAV